jgi:hypothetical protein
MESARSKGRGTRLLLAFGLVFGPLILILSTLAQPTPKNLTLMCAILSSGLYALVLYVSRARWMPLLSGHPLRNAFLFGSLNAAILETVFWAWEKLFAASGVAASPDLLVDLFITMPWYIGMAAIFVWAQNRRRFSNATVLLLGGVYELGADGFLGGMIFGGGLLNPGAWVLLALAYWEFILVYAAMVLPPALLIGRALQPPKPSYPSWADALAPLLWLIPYFLYLALLFWVL